MKHFSGTLTPDDSKTDGFELDPKPETTTLITPIPKTFTQMNQAMIKNLRAHIDELLVQKSYWTALAVKQGAVLAKIESLLKQNLTETEKLSLISNQIDSLKNQG